MQERWNLNNSIDVITLTNMHNTNSLYESLMNKIAGFFFAFLIIRARKQTNELLHHWWISWFWRNSNLKVVRSIEWLLCPLLTIKSWSWSYVVGFTTTCVVSAYHHYSCSNPDHGEAYSIQHYVIKFVSDLRQVGGFLRENRFPPPMKLSVTIWLKYYWKWR